jgi:uncharacterized ion transporter superfamily protein YfcC
MKRIPNTYIIIASLIVLSAALTWFIPAGEYITTEDNDLVFQHIENNPQSWQVFTSLQKGFIKQASIIIFVLIVGGVFWLFNSTRAIDVGIFTLLRKLKKFETNNIISSQRISQIILVLIAIVFSVFGAVFGMSEETIAFVGIVIPLVVSLGYDSITGLNVVFVAAGLGFAGAVLNPFTIGIAQGIAGLQIFSGLEYRFFCWIVINIVGLSYIMIYAGKVYKNPTKSMVYNSDSFWRKKAGDTIVEKVRPSKQTWVYFGLSFLITLVFAIIYQKTTISIGNSEKTFPALAILSGTYLISGIVMLRKSVHYFIINILFFIILYLIIGVLGYEWYINEISALFLGGGILAGMIYSKKGNEIVKDLIDGAKDIFGAAIVIGLAGGIIIILEEGQIIHSILHAAANAMNGLGRIGTVGTMYIVQTLINIIIPSGSAKAAITMPIMAPFSDLVNLSRQATVMAFQFGDGFTNMITPTSPVLMAVLGVSKIPYTKWFKWVFPLIIILIITGFILLIPTVLMQLKGF